MKRNPLVPFAIIAGLAIVLMITMGVWGGSIHQEKAAEKKEASQQEKANGDSLKPEDIFKQNCASCHGANLEGGIGPELDKIGSQMSKADIKKQIMQGGGGMPANAAGSEAAAEKVADWLSKKK